MAAPVVDTDYKLEHFISGPITPDLAYLFDRVADATVETAAEAPPGRVVDVGSGSSRELARLAGLGWEAYAVEPSVPMLGLARGVNEEFGTEVRLVRAIGEQLPFADASIDVVTCQGALDHFADRHAFMKEAARVLKPGGRAVIALHNFEGVTTKLGRLLHPLAKTSRLHHCAEWPCWQIPPDHNFKGDWPLIRTLGHPWLTLERAYGISMLSQFYGWGRLLDRVPQSLAQRVLRSLDELVYRRPSWSDEIVSVWRPAPS
jgi:SAM-dependent methyltransferase